MDTRKLDRISTQLDDIDLTVEELKEEPTQPDVREVLDDVHATLETIADTVDRIEEETNTPTTPKNDE